MSDALYESFGEVKEGTVTEQRGDSVMIQKAEDGKFIIRDEAEILRTDS